MKTEEEYKAEVLQLMRDLYPTLKGEERKRAEHLFPELKESEDERIRKAIIEFFELQDDNTTYSLIPKRDILAWIEKQGEQNPADKVSLNFKKGDVLYEQKTMSILLIYERNGSWLMTFCDYWMLKEKFHVEFPYENYGFVREMSLVPATKEQRDLLFKKMHEEGYEWDAEKKELKRIERKPAWSEEDERMYSRIATFIPLHLTAESYTACITWFKSLKERVQCKSNK